MNHLKANMNIKHCYISTAVNQDKFLFAPSTRSVTTYI